MIKEIIEQYQREHKNWAEAAVYLSLEQASADKWDGYYSLSWSKETPVLVRIPPVRFESDLFKEAEKLFPTAELRGAFNSVVVGTPESPDMLYLYRIFQDVRVESNEDVCVVVGQAATLREAAEALRVQLMIKRNVIDQALKLLEDIPC